MEVLKNNFQSASKVFIEILDQSEFISIDLEFAGLPKEQSGHDTPMECYQRHIYCANNSRIIQFGICCFVLDKSSSQKTYTGYPFNFYLFPSSYNDSFKIEINLDLSCIEYNVQSGGVDFSKWITQGVPYFNRHLQSLLKKNIYRNPTLEMNNFEIDVNAKNNSKAKDDTAPVINDKKSKGVIDSKFQDFQKWLVKSQNDDYFILEETRYASKKYFVELVKYNCKDRVPSLIFTETTNSNKVPILKILKINSDGKDAYLRDVYNGLDLKFNEAKGFSHLWDSLLKVISSKKIPVVAHQSFMDHLYILSHFEGKLSSNYFEFKNKLNEIFPVIYDTKFLSSSLNITYHLEKLFNYLQSSESNGPKINCEMKMLEGSSNINVAHNAAYDAYMTGVAFLELKERIGDISKFKNIIPLFKNQSYAIKLNDNSDFFRTDKTFVIKLTETKTQINEFNKKEKKCYREDEENKITIQKLLSKCPDSFSDFNISYQNSPFPSISKVYLIYFENSVNIDVLINCLVGKFKVLTIKEHYDETVQYLKDTVYCMKSF